MKQGNQLDPLRRVFVPRERKQEDGTAIFRTLDKQSYIRGVDGVIRRETPKINGKQAKKARKYRG